MALKLTSLAELATVDFDDIIDVRSPAEFAEDHVPGAINLPVLSDAERAEVGTIYVQDSSFKARKIGAALVAQNAARHLQGPLADRDGGWRPLIYCWRGGQRSGSFAAILSQIGWRTEVLEGGYKSHRRLVVNSLYERAFPAPVVLLDGNTGTAKTEVIARLPALGVQSIDLEGLANHRGSALGGQGAQPSQKAFETALAMQVAALDPARPVVVEAESSRIGRLNLPARLFEAMKQAPMIQITAPVDARAAFLVHSYGDVIDDLAAITERLEWLTGLQGRERVAHWVALAGEGEFEALARELIEHHYDPRYAKVRTRRSEARVTVTADALDPASIDALAEQVAVAVRSL